MAEVEKVENARLEGRLKSYRSIYFSCCGRVRPHHFRRFAKPTRLAVQRGAGEPVLRRRDLAVAL